MYNYECELIFKSYMPKGLEKGMYFINNIYGKIILWELQEIPFDKDKFIIENGAPVELYIIDSNNIILAKPIEIGWFDKGEDFDELSDITLQEINIIISEYNGYIEIEINEEPFDEYEEIIPNNINNKIIIKYIENDEI